jgi:hypothetical protein
MVFGARREFSPAINSLRISRFPATQCSNKSRLGEVLIRLSSYAPNVRLLVVRYIIYYAVQFAATVWRRRAG